MSNRELAAIWLVLVALSVAIMLVLAYLVYAIAVWIG
jgi:hypothetical protein